MRLYQKPDGGWGLVDRQGILRPTPPAHAPPCYLVDQRSVAQPLPSWNKVRVKPPASVGVGCENLLNSIWASPVSDNHLCPAANRIATNTMRRPANPIGAPAIVVRRHARSEHVPRCGLMGQRRAERQMPSMNTRVKHLASVSVDSDAPDRSVRVAAVEIGHGVNAIPVRRTSIPIGAPLLPRRPHKKCAVVLCLQYMRRSTST